MAAVETQSPSYEVIQGKTKWVTGYYPVEAKPYSSVGKGSTAEIWEHSFRPGVVIKTPHSHEDMLDPSLQNKYRTEAAILESLDSHPRVVKYGLLDPPLPHKGLLLVEAPNGDVATYLTTHGDTIDVSLRLKWCKQAAEGSAYCHAHGVLHCDLRPDNTLLDANLDLSICDFGGSKYAQYNGGGLPDAGFVHPKDDFANVTEAIEVFGLGSCMYTFMTGLIPHGTSAFSAHHMFDYDKKFARLINQSEFPDVSALDGGDLIQQCWTGSLISAGDVYSCYVNLERQLEEQNSGSC
ncbi:MAG: hypothetical protein Q9195_006340 [Heterodermia aff. obscurata]